MITILGPTASGKTQLASHTAYLLNGEVISADSRQVYKNMNIGTGKDYADYVINNIHIPHHLIDIAEPGDEYNLFNFKTDFSKIYQEILKQKKVPILCGGTGMYVEAILRGYSLIEVPMNDSLRKELENKSDGELISLLKKFRTPHSTTDTENRSRLIKAIEILTYYAEHPDQNKQDPIESIIFGIYFDREIIRKRITERLHKRFKEGMIDEVKGLIEKGVPTERLMSYGLEYRFITQYLLNEIVFDEMVAKLNTAIHQYAKRQMTWFRKMERSGFKIHWIDGTIDLEQKIKIILDHYKK